MVTRQALGRAEQVSDIQGRDLRAPHAGHHAEGQQRPVAHLPQRVSLDLVQHGPDHVAISCRLARGRLAPGPAGAGQHVEDHRATTNLVRDDFAGLAVGVANGGHAQRQRLGRQARAREIGQVDGNQRRIGREGTVAVLAAPQDERRPVLLVLGPCRSGARGIDEGAGGFDLLGREDDHSAMLVADGDVNGTHDLAFDLAVLAPFIVHPSSPALP